MTASEQHALVAWSIAESGKPPRTVADQHGAIWDVPRILAAAFAAWDQRRGTDAEPQWWSKLAGLRAACEYVDGMGFDKAVEWKPGPQREQSPDDRMLAYHRANPLVFALLHETAMRLKAEGHKHYGVKALFEQLRFHERFHTLGDYKLNNNATAWYARYLMDHEPQLRGFFETRERRRNSKAA